MLHPRIAKRVLFAIIVPMVVCVGPLALWASTVEPTQLDPELPAAAWVFVLWFGGGAGIVATSVTVAIAAALGVFRAPR